MERVLFAIRTSRHESSGYTPFESFSKVFHIYLLVPFNRKAILPIEIEIAGHTEKDERYIFDDIEKRMQMFIAAKNKLFDSVAQNIATAQKCYTQDYNRRQTITEVFRLNFRHNSNIFINIHVF